MTIAVLQGDCRTILPTLPANSVQCCVTSPPYFGLRAYLPDGHPDKAKEIGREETPDTYVVAMVEVFREVWRVLREDGTVWLNIGDSYATGTTASCKATAIRGPKVPTSWAGRSQPERVGAPAGYKTKDLLMMPARLALALQADGWYLRSDIIWHKPNPMPESVTDRPTCAHEHVFLLTKSPSYLYDAEAIKEPAVADHPSGNGFKRDARQSYTNKDGSPRGSDNQWNQVGGSRNARNVWTIPTKPFSGAHFATMPPDLVERCIRAGTSEKGCCPTCGAPWMRITERVDQGYDGSKYGERAVASTGGARTGGTARSTLGSSNGKMTGKHLTVGWAPTCGCRATCLACEGGGLGHVVYSPRTPGGLVESSCEACEGRGTIKPTPVPCTVLDPFGGAGTTALVAQNLNRSAISIELNPQYITMQNNRIHGPLFS